MMIWILLIGMLFAHEDVPSTVCKNGENQIVITKNKTNYSITLPGKKPTITFQTPITKDVYDEKNKQLFDTYQFDNGNIQLQIKRPETKGPIKSLRAFYKNQIYTCD